MGCPHELEQDQCQDDECCKCVGDAKDQIQPRQVLGIWMGYCLGADMLNLHGIGTDALCIFLTQFKERALSRLVSGRVPFRDTAV